MKEVQTFTAMFTVTLRFSAIFSADKLKFRFFCEWNEVILCQVEVGLLYPKLYLKARNSSDAI